MLRRGVPAMIKPSDPTALRLHELGPFQPGACIGRKIIHESLVESTNDMAWSLVEAGEPEGAVLSADAQTQGRGRTGNHWHSAAGLGLWFSVLLRPAIEPDRLGLITCLAALAVAEAVIDKTALSARIKWPNDVWIEGRKVAGILTEMRSRYPEPKPVVVGFGVNVNHEAEDFSGEIADTALSLRMAAGAYVDRTDLFGSILGHLHRWYTAFGGGDDSAIEERYRELSLMPGRKVRFHFGHENVEGVVTGISCAKGLCLRLDTGEERIFRAEHIAQVDFNDI
jgi:BirA family biotin operon repressor/biotin-[acetyl-CoA-carboxylase] ligase